MLLLVQTCFGLQLVPQLPPTRPAAVARAAPPAMLDFDANTLIAGLALFGGLGGGIALISFTDNAGKRNEAVENAQPCVVCNTEKVVPCTICQGSGGKCTHHNTRHLIWSTAR